MKLINSGYLLLILLLLMVSCSDVKSTRYQDTSYLEIPPEMEIAERPKAIAEEKEEIIVSGLGKDILLAGSEDKPIIKIKKLFERSWNIVEQALELNEIEITDKNREQGVFYVLFDPDTQTSDESELIDTVTFFLFDDDYDEAAYKVVVEWRDSDTEVNVELVDQQNDGLLDDDDEDFGGSVDGGGMLIKRLYKTIRDDLPLN